MDTNDIELFDLYLEDMREHLQLLNESLLLLDNDLGNQDIINTIFRAFHTMKGSTATVGFLDSAEIIHRMEDLLQSIRDGRISVDSNIVQLLFACHDFIEKAVEQLGRTGSEDGIDCSGIMEQLDQYAVQNLSTGDANGSGETGKVRQNDLTAGPSELDYITRKASSGYIAYAVTIKLASDCVFRTIRAWMVYEELERTAEIVKSCPAKPTKEEFDNGSFVFEGTDIKALVVSARTGEEIREDLHSSLTEIDQITVDHYTHEQEIADVVNSIIESDTASDGMVGREYPDAVIGEIRNQVCLSELACLDIVSDLGNEKLINDIWQRFHTMKTLSAHINHSTVYNISAGTETLIDNFLKRKDNLDERYLDIIIRSLALVKELCDDTALSSSLEYLGNVDRHLDLLFKCSGGTMAESLPDGPSLRQNNLKLGEILAAKGVVNPENIDYLIAKQHQSYPGLKFGQVALKEGKASLKNVVEALNEQTGSKADLKGQLFIRIPEQKVDSLVDMLGELLITQSLHKQEISDLLAEARLSGKLSNNIIRMERITKDIQTIAMSLRMVSLRQSFQKLLRVGRDVAKELDKDIAINLSGEDTEIDRCVVERIQDPLMHLVRNAIAHGIEPAGERLARGKQAQGQVCINAYNKRGFVYIEVADDGGGLEIDLLWRKAKEKNLVDPNRNYSDEEILKLIYLPGFSTQDSIDSISGRGVGMNVVETEIVNIGGKIEISNDPGRGCAFILKIPINLATINGTIVDVFGERYILPTLNIKQILKPEGSQWVNIKGKPDMIKIRDEVIQVIPIDRILGMNSSAIDYREGMIIVLELEHILKALPVRSVLDKQEIVVKPLGSEFRGMDFLSGATILGDGLVSLILDIETLFKRALR